MELLGDVGQVEARFDPFGDSVNLAQHRCMVCTKRTMGMENFLGMPDGPPRWRESNGILFRYVWRYC
jgi:hypothetical protein